MTKAREQALAFIRACTSLNPAMAEQLADRVAAGCAMIGETEDCDDPLACKMPKHLHLPAIGVLNNVGTAENNLHFAFHCVSKIRALEREVAAREVGSSFASVIAARLSSLRPEEIVFCSGGQPVSAGDLVKGLQAEPRGLLADEYLETIVSGAIETVRTRSESEMRSACTVRGVRDLS